VFRNIAGTYTSASHPTLVSGAGSLVVTTSAPLAPTGLVATAISNISIGLTWSDKTGDETGYLLQSGPLTLNGTEPTLNIPSGIMATISSPIRGTAGWVKSGPGTLTLSGASSFTGNLAAIAGNLQFATGLSLDPVAVIQLGDVSGTENAIISWNNNSLTTHLPLIVRSGSSVNKTVSVSSGVTSSIASLELNDHLTKIGNGTLTVTGSTTLKGGNRILGTDAGSLNLGGVLSSVGGTHGLTKSGVGILRFNGDNIGYNGAIVLNQGFLHVGHTNALGSGAFTNSANSNTFTNVSGSAIVLSNSSYSIGSNLTVGGSNSAADIHTGPGAFSLTGTFNTLPESSLFQAAGYDWQISYAGGDGNDEVVTVRPVSPAEQWRLTHFGSIANAGIGADNQDPDQDGVINLLERAFALKPLGQDTAGLPSSSIEAGVFSLVYRQSRAATDLDFVVEISPDLSAGSWRAAVLAPAENTDGTQVIADDSLPDVQVHRFTTLPGQKGFYRIRVD
jgi:fibronectin-binding autotransporter adhesin